MPKPVSVAIDVPQPREEAVDIEVVSADPPARIVSATTGTYDQLPPVIGRALA
jgi:hypothetical protein